MDISVRTSGKDKHEVLFNASESGELDRDQALALANSMIQAVEQILWNCDEPQLSEAADSLSILTARKLQKRDKK